MDPPHLSLQARQDLMNDGVPVGNVVSSMFPASSALLVAASNAGPTTPRTMTTQSPPEAGSSNSYSPVGVDRLKGAYFRAVRAIGAENSRDARDDHRSGLTDWERPSSATDNTQWNIVRDQMASLTREFTRLRDDFDTLHLSTSRVEARQTESTRQWSLAQAEVAKETMAVMTQMTADQRSLKQEQEQVVRQIRFEVEQRRSELSKRDAEVSLQFADMRRALEQEAQNRNRASVHEEVTVISDELRRPVKLELRTDAQRHTDAAQMSAAEAHLSAEIGKLQNKLEWEVKQLKKCLETEKSDRAAEDSKCRISLSAVSGEVQSGYTDLRDEVKHAFSEHDVDFAKLQEILREHTANIAEQSAQVREERALRTAGRQEMELKFREELDARGAKISEELDAAVGTQKNLVEEARQLTTNLQTLRAHVLEQEHQLDQDRDISSVATGSPTGANKVPAPFANGANAATTPAGSLAARALVEPPGGSGGSLHAKLLLQPKAGSLNLAPAGGGQTAGSPTPRNRAAVRTSSQGGSMHLPRAQSPPRTPPVPPVGMLPPGFPGPSMGGSMHLPRGHSPTRTPPVGPPVHPMGMMSPGVPGMSLSGVPGLMPLMPPGVPGLMPPGVPGLGHLGLPPGMSPGVPGLGLLGSAASYAALINGARPLASPRPMGFGRGTVAPQVARQQSMPPTLRKP